MALWERDYMLERDKRRVTSDESPCRRQSTSQADPPWMKIIVGLCLLAVLSAFFVREYRKTHQQPVKRVIRSPEVTKPKQQDQKPPKPIHFI